MRNRIAASVMAVVAALACSSVVSAQRGQARQGGPAVREGFISEGIPKMPNPPGPAPKRDLSGAWVGPGPTNRPEPVPPMTPAGEAIFKQRKAYGLATNLGNKDGPPGSSNDPFITCDPLGFPRNLIAHAITSRGGTLFGSAPDRILIAGEQQRVWREIWMDGRALPKAVDVRGAPESRFYGSRSATGRTTTRSSSTRPVWTNAVAGRSGTPAQLHGARPGAVHAYRSIQPPVDRHRGRSEVLYEAVGVHAGEFLLDESAGVCRNHVRPVGGARVSRHAGQAVWYSDRRAQVAGPVSGLERFSRPRRPAPLRGMQGSPAAPWRRSGLSRRSRGTR